MVSSALPPLTVVDIVLQEMDDGTFTVAAGGGGNAFAAVITANGSVVRTAASEALPDSSLSVAFGSRWAVAVQPDGKIVLVGTDRFFNGPMFYPPDAGGPSDEAGGGANAATPDFLIKRFDWAEKEDAPAPEAPAPQPPPRDPAPGPTDPDGGGQVEGGGGAGSAPVVTARFIGRPVVAAHKRWYTFKVAYASAGGPGSPAGAPLLPALLGDIVITDPSGAYRSATLLKVARGRVTGSFVARYRLDAPSGVFDAGDAGRYTVRLGGRLVAPTANASAPVAGDTVGTFEVRDRRRPSRAISHAR